MFPAKFPFKINCFTKKESQSINFFTGIDINEIEKKMTKKKTLQNFTEGQSTILWKLTFKSGIILKFVLGPYLKYLL